MIAFRNTNVYNMGEALLAMRLSYGSTSDSCPADRRFSGDIILGQKDRRLAMRLIAKGPSHRKFMRQILVSVDITAPRYWWTQFDTYKVGVTSCSESTMHTIMKRELTTDDFSFDGETEIERQAVLALEELRKAGEFKRLIALLPQGYKQKRHVTMNYEAVRNIVGQREGHKLTEWEGFIAWSRTLPYADVFLKAARHLPKEKDNGWH